MASKETARTASRSIAAPLGAPPAPPGAVLASRKLPGTFGSLVLFSLLVAAWLLLLFTGWSFGGAVHLLLVGAIFVFPWRDRA